MTNPRQADRIALSDTSKHKSGNGGIVQKRTPVRRSGRHVKPAQASKTPSNEGPASAGTITFAAVGCRAVSYDFTLPRDSFDLEAFYAAGRIAPKERTSWCGSCAPKHQTSGYHIHFDGRVEEKKVRLRVEYVKDPTTPRPDEREPFAETFMNWLARFILNPTSHAAVRARFEKSHERWRSRFNLPFKVTLSGVDTEVAIDGISLILPENESGATHGWLTKLDKYLLVDVCLDRRINPKQFQLDEELLAINESIRMFIEEIGK